MCNTKDMEVLRMGETTFIDNIINAILEPIMNGVEVVVGFILGSRFLTLTLFLLFITWLGYYIMKVDKRYAKEDKRRVSENNLMLIAIVGGSLGMYIGMYKFKHKTLHKKFTIGVPLIMLIQVAYVVYLITTNILVK